eukprot:1141500-Pelagomonas_calceolata.AAC.2
MILRLNNDTDTPLVDYLQGSTYKNPNGELSCNSVDAKPCSYTLLEDVVVSIPASEDLVPPIAVLTGPSTFRTPCPNERFATVYVESSASGDASGRPLKNKTWGLESSGDCIPHDIDDEGDPLSVLLKAANNCMLEEGKQGQGWKMLTFNLVRKFNAPSLSGHMEGLLWPLFAGQRIGPGALFAQTLCTCHGQIPDAQAHIGTEDLYENTVAAMRAWLRRSAMILTSISLKLPSSYFDFCNRDQFTTLKMESNVLDGMAAGVHCITLSVTNFLGKESDKAAEFRIQKLGEYQWSCVSNDCPLLTEVGEEYQSSVAKDLTPSDLVGRVVPGSEYEFQLSARMRGPNGTISDSAVEVRQVRTQVRRV